MRITFNRLFCLWTLMCPAAVCAASTPFSQYGVIQNVQNYSSNPFWNPNSPYNLRMPTAVYAQGPNVETSDCQAIVSALVAEQCSVLNNCRDTQISDIRPNIMLQLSRIPNGNYATSCAGYLDTIFEAYVRQNANSVPTSPVSFPASMGANPNADATGYKIQNPVKINVPTWAADMAERKQELQDLQSGDAANTASVQHAAFPKTVADLTFSQRVDLETEGYEPYKDNKAYVGIEFESKEEYEARHNAGEEAKLTIAKAQKNEECKKQGVGWVVSSSGDGCVCDKKGHYVLSGTKCVCDMARGYKSSGGVCIKGSSGRRNGGNYGGDDPDNEGVRVQEILDALLERLPK